MLNQSINQYTVYFTAFCSGGGIFPGHGVFITLCLLFMLLRHSWLERQLICRNFVDYKILAYS